MSAPERDSVDHVLFCVADQWRHDALGAAGTPGVQTPNLDALAADGVRFTDHWCQASPCGPSRSSLLTGTHASTHGQWTNDDLATHGLVTLPAAVRSAGVTPLLVGYTDTPQPDGGTVDPAFDVVRPFVWQQGFPDWRAALEAKGYGPTVFDHPWGPYAPQAERAPGEDPAPAHYRAEDSDVAHLTEAAVDALADLPDRSLLHVNWLRPHPPMTAPDPYHRLVHPDEVTVPARPLDLAAQCAVHPYFEATVPGRSLRQYTQIRERIEDVTEYAERWALATYYGLCAEVDHHLGLLLDELRRRGLYDRTLIIVTSDHGDAFGDHWIYGRRGPYDGHGRVPCIVRDPRREADGTRGATVDVPTANIDLLPTICEALGVATPETVEGRSLLPFLGGRPVTDWRDHIRFEMSWADHLRGVDEPDALRFHAVRTDRWRLVHFPAMPPLLHDLREDPEETVDRAADPTLRSVVAELTALAT